MNLSSDDKRWILTVLGNALGNPVFAIDANPAEVDVFRNGKEGSTTTITAIASEGRFPASIALEADGLPLGASAEFSPKSIAPPGGPASKLRLLAGPATALGTYPVTVTGTFAGIAQSTIVNLTVEEPGFTIQALITEYATTPFVFSIEISCALEDGFDAPIDLTASAARAEYGKENDVPPFQYRFDPETIPAPGSATATLEIFVQSGAVVKGWFGIKVVATAGMKSSTSAHTIEVDTGPSAPAIVPAPPA